MHSGCLEWYSKVPKLIVLFCLVIACVSVVLFLLQLLSAPKSFIHIIALLHHILLSNQISTCVKSLLTTMLNFLISLLQESQFRFVSYK